MDFIYIVVIFPINAPAVVDKTFFQGDTKTNYARARNRLAELQRQGLRAAMHEHPWIA